LRDLAIGAVLGAGGQVVPIRLQAHSESTPTRWAGNWSRCSAAGRPGDADNSRTRSTVDRDDPGLARAVDRRTGDCHARPGEWPSGCATWCLTADNGRRRPLAFSV